MGHTKGKWEVGRNLHPMSENYGHLAIGSPERELAIAVIPTDEPEDEANAALMAAAPTMYRLLRLARTFFSRHCRTDTTLYTWLEETYDTLHELKQATPEPPKENPEKTPE